MHQLAGQVLILLVAIIAPNDSVSCILQPGSLIWPLHARERALTCTGGGHSGAGGRMVEGSHVVCGRAAVGCGMQGGKSASAPMPSGLTRVARA